MTIRIGEELFSVMGSALIFSCAGWLGHVHGELLISGYR